jgi:hypothetical protein
MKISKFICPPWPLPSPCPWPLEKLKFAISAVNIPKKHIFIKKTEKHKIPLIRVRVSKKIGILKIPLVYRFEFKKYVSSQKFRPVALHLVPES